MALIMMVSEEICLICISWGSNWGNFSCADAATNLFYKLVRLINGDVLLSIFLFSQNSGTFNIWKNLFGHDGYQ